MLTVNKRTIVLFGGVNAGKSTLFNALIGQDSAIVSNIAGTTTDINIKAAELIGYGPVTFIDTAGLGDKTELGGRRMEKALRALERADIAVHVVADGASFGERAALPFEVPVITVITHCESPRPAEGNTVFLCNADSEGIAALGDRIVELLHRLDSSERELLMEGLVPAGGRALLVMPMDSEAPAGRIILPQVRVLRDCIDLELPALAVNEKALPAALKDFTPDIVVTDSKIFALVASLLPPDMPLTSFSILMARGFGGFMQMLEGMDTIKTLKDGDRVVILEGCTHTKNHEDIGTVIIPKAIKKLSGKNIEFDHLYGYDFPAEPQKYALAVQCGGCMQPRRTLQNRLARMKALGLPVTNYGLVLAEAAGILDRAAGPVINAGGNGSEN